MVAQHWGRGQCPRHLPGLWSPPRTPSPLAAGLFPHGVFSPIPRRVCPEHTLTGPWAHTPLIPGGHTVGDGFPESVPTPIPKCLFHSKWPSPGPSLAGMGGRVPARSETARQRHRPHAQQLLPEHGTHEHSCAHSAGLRPRQLPREPAGPCTGPGLAGSGQQHPSSWASTHQGGDPEPRMCAALAPPARSSTEGSGLCWVEGRVGDAGWAKDDSRHQGARRSTTPSPGLGEGSNIRTPPTPIPANQKKLTLGGE